MDIIIEGNGILYQIEIKQSVKVNVDETSTFTISDILENKKRGMGCNYLHVPSTWSSS